LCGSNFRNDGSCRFFFAPTIEEQNEHYEAVRGFDHTSRKYDG
jgi:hypothetical protein